MQKNSGATCGPTKSVNKIRLILSSLKTQRFLFLDDDTEKKIFIPVLSDRPTCTKFCTVFKYEVLMSRYRLNHYHQVLKILTVHSPLHESYQVKEIDNFLSIL